MVELIWVKSFYNAIVFFVSLLALIFALRFVHQTQEIMLPEAPKATQDLQKVFLPPIFRMQWFVFSFDFVVMLYYVYQMPCWDCIKSKFPFFQYEAKTAEKADCTNLLLTIMFDLISKGLALGIIMTTSYLSFENIDKINQDYSEDKRNGNALKNLTDAKEPLKMANILNAVLAGLMLISFIISAITLGKNLRSAPARKVSDE